MEGTKLTLEEEATPTAFITQFGQPETKGSVVIDSSQNLASIQQTDSIQQLNTTTLKRIPTRFGVVGEIDVINGLMERVRSKTRKINPNSPRTKQAMENLGIPVEACIIKYIFGYMVMFRK